MYLHSVITSLLYIVVFIVSGGVRHSHNGFKWSTYVRGVSRKRGMRIICYCLWFYVIDFSLALLQTHQSCLKWLLMLTEHFLLPLLHIKSIQLAKHVLLHRKCNVLVTAPQADNWLTVKRVWLHCKQIQRSLLCCISDKAAAKFLLLH